jgi:uncharacterized phage protein (TIGR02220 family)
VDQSPSQVVDHRHFGYFRVDDAIFDQGLSIYAFAVYVFMCRCADSKGMSFPSHALMAKKTGMGRTRLKEALAELRLCGLLTWAIGRDSGVNTYTVVGVAPRDQGWSPDGQGGSRPATTPSRPAPTEGRPREGRPREGHELTTLSGTKNVPDIAYSPNGRVVGESVVQAAREILAFLNHKTGRQYQPVKGNLDFIEARLREGATVNQCRAIIGRKARAWNADEKMREYLRPATLFNRTKFAQYQGELPPTAFEEHTDD